MRIPLAKGHAVEERACNAWPALQTLLVGGWTVRFADGFTQRANSASPYASDALPVEAVAAEIEGLYARHGQRTIFRLTSMVRAADSATLAARGYRPHDESILMIAPLPPGLAPDPLAHLTETPPADWIDGFARGNRYGPRHRPALEKMLAVIKPPAIYATLRENGRAVAYGLGVVERGMVGLFDILVEQEERGRGLGRRLVRSIMAAGAAAGASEAYLQVLAANAPALALYGGEGFREAYRYTYWITGD